VNALRVARLGLARGGIELRQAFTYVPDLFQNLGSLIPNPRFFPLVMLPFGAIVAVSGIFYPITHLAGWLQAVGQLFPVYWLGLGMRAALLPPGLASVEIDGLWRLPYVFLALALWSVLGLVAAPTVLRRMARRESGSRVAARRERAMLRAT
jgi:ABC-2 type transport system permease protein